MLTETILTLSDSLNEFLCVWISVNPLYRYVHISNTSAYTCTGFGVSL